MPYYTWLCVQCETKCEIMRSMKDSDVPPEKCESCGNKTDWVKLISSGIAKMYGDNWGGSKGNWGKA